MFTAMLPGELASSAGNYDGIQTANFMYNVVIINADNALNPSAKMRIIQYRKIQPYFNYENSKQTLDAAILKEGIIYIGIQSWGKRNMEDIPTSQGSTPEIFV
jgi:hypothetical protein